MEHVGSKTNAFSLALAEATERLADIERRYASLATEREQLQAVVTSLTALVPSTGEVNREPARAVVPISSNRPTAQQAELAPVWKLTEEQFLAAGNTSMSVPELANRLNGKRSVSQWDASLKSLSLVANTANSGCDRSLLTPKFNTRTEAIKSKAPAEAGA